MDKHGLDILGIRSYGAFRDALAGSGCTRCGLAEGRTHIVVDRGNPRSRVVVIGEGPGVEEDARGLAFVGRAGRLLDRIFAEAGYDTNRDLLISNVVKCRPPGNRAPRASEAAACRPFLDRQFALLKPKAVLLLGASAVRSLLPEKKREKMGDLVGRSFTNPMYPGVPFFVLYHPAYLLRDPRRVPETVGHIESLSELIG